MLEHERFGHGYNRAQTSFPHQGPGPFYLYFTSMKVVDIDSIRLLSEYLTGTNNRTVLIPSRIPFLNPV